MYALVTGASGGLGYHIAEELKRRGYSLILVSKSAERLERAAEKLGAEHQMALDLSKDYRALGPIIEKYRPEVIVNNAGFGIYGEFPEQDAERIVDMLELNVVALTWITHRGMQVMERGYILNISSVAACHPLPRLAAYSASKAYVEHFSRSLIREGGNVHVSYLLLGPTKTSFFKNASMPVGKIERIMLSPEKVAHYAVNKMFRKKTRIVPGVLYKLYCLFG